VVCLTAVEQKQGRFPSAFFSIVRIKKYHFTLTRAGPLIAAVRIFAHPVKAANLPGECMKYSSILLLTTLALSGMAVAEDSNSTNNASTDDKVECIVDFVAAELEEDQQDKYVEECLRQKLAKKQQEAKEEG
jgi:hypothetical protein